MLNKHFRSIDIIKGIAMIMIIMVHYQQSFDLCKWFSYFELGCAMFFVCSGFGITSLINSRYPNILTDSKSLTSFYYSRFKALAPGWYLAFLIIFLVNTFGICFTGFSLNFGTNREPVSIIINLLFLNGLFPFCNNNVMPGGWYIGATAILYLLTPFFLLVMKKFKSRKLFFVLSSAIGMSIWFVLKYILFKEGFSSDGFDYNSFLFHYPEYMLGIVLYFDLDQKILNEKQIMLCLPLGLVVFLFSYVLFYSNIPHTGFLCSWSTGLGVYLLLYYLISNESNRTASKVGEVLAGFGENSYGIYLLHFFWSWTFISYLNKVLSNYGLTLIDIPCFIIMIPLVLIGSYYTGLLFNKITKKISTVMF